MKHFLCALTFSVFAFFGFVETAFAQQKVFFNGYTGFLVGMQNDDDKDYFDPSFSGESFFSGQVDFFGRFFLQGEFYLRANDIFDFNTFKEEDMNANFRVENIAATVKANSLRASHFLSLYRGNFEPLGSELFLQRQFGISSICSSFTENYHGSEGVTFYPFFADVGFSYVFHPETNFAFGVNIYQNNVENTNSDKDSSDKKDDVLCLDLRFAGIYKSTIIDFCVGLGLPRDINTSDEDSILSIKEMQLHCGLNLFAGNKNTGAFLVQVGINKASFTKKDTSSDILKMKDIYAFAEARTLGKYGFDFAGFLLPVESTKDMIFLRTIANRYEGTESIFGANINIYKENIGNEKSNIKLGLHTTVAFSTIDKDEKDDDMKITIALSPYVGIGFLGGTLGASVSANINVTDITYKAEKSYSAFIGFKRNF